MNYHVYVICDCRKMTDLKYNDYRFEFEPIYIGISKHHKRRFEHISSAINNCKYDSNNLKKNKIRSIISENEQPITKIIYDGLIKSEAIALEIKLIKFIGRIDLNTGPLTNLTDGGEYIVNLSEATRKKMSERQKGKKHPNYGKRGEGMPMFGKKHSKESLQLMSNVKKGIKFTKEHRDNLSKSLKGRLGKKGVDNPLYGKPLSDETKLKISKANKGKLKPSGENSATSKYWTVISPDGIIYEVKGLANFCKENGLSYPCMFDVANGRQKQHKNGWRCKRK